MVPVSSSGRTALVRRLAAIVGFDGAGVASAEPLDDTPVAAWLSLGHAGSMTYLGGGRGDPRRVLAGARSIVCVALAYGRGGASAGAGRPGVLCGTIARYARGLDYHDTLKRKLRALAACLRERFPSARFRAAVDTAPLLEKPLAVRAGLGWVGKHTLLLRPPFGSWLVLGELLTDLDLEPGAPVPEKCGTCTRCLAACPTGALVGPKQLDARRCIAYLTIEHRGVIPRELRPSLGTRIFGCDACQEACPWNRSARSGRDPGWTRSAEAAYPRLEDLAVIDQKGFERRFARTPVARTGRVGLARNACVALGNAGSARSVPALERALGDVDPLVRGHAAWALGRLAERGADGGAGGRILARAMRGERDPEVLEEIRGARAGSAS